MSEIFVYIHVQYRKATTKTIGQVVISKRYNTKWIIRNFSNKSFFENTAINNNYIKSFSFQFLEHVYLVEKNPPEFSS